MDLAEIFFMFYLSKFLLNKAIPRSLTQILGKFIFSLDTLKVAPLKYFTVDEYLYLKHVFRIKILCRFRKSYFPGKKMKRQIAIKDLILFVWGPNCIFTSFWVISCKKNVGI